MRKKLTLILLVVVVFALTGVGFFVFRSHQAKKPVAKLTAVKAEAKPAEAAPVKAETKDHLVIDKTGVNAKVVSVGVTKEGNMDVPGNIYDVGWYSKGAKPGAKGTAVLAGHLDNAGGEPGVFAKLKDLVAGDVVKIVSPDGNEIRFKVTKTKLYGAADKPTEVFTSSSGSHLNLITCTGSWDKNKSQYDKRLVVFTELTK